MTPLEWSCSLSREKSHHHSRRFVFVLIHHMFYESKGVVAFCGRRVLIELDMYRNSIAPEI